MTDFWKINALVQIEVALVLIVILLMYIAYKLSEKGGKPSRSKR